MRTLRLRKRETVLYFDCSGWHSYWNFAHEVARKLDIRKEQRIDASVQNLGLLLAERSSRGRRPLLLFFDEVDHLLASRDWSIFRDLHAAVSNGYARVVFAGFRLAPRLNNDAESPFLEGLEPLELQPLSKDDTEALICEPLESAGFHIEDREGVTDLIADASAGHPFIIQFFGREMYSIASSRESYALTPDDVSKVKRGSRIGRFLLSYLLINTRDHQGKIAIDERLCVITYVLSCSKSAWTGG